MSRRKRHNKVAVEGLISYADNDPIAEVSIATDYGDELPIDPDGQMSNPFQWIDSLVRARGRFVIRDGRRYLRIDRIEDANSEPAYGSSLSQEYDWDGGDADWDDGGTEYEDRY